VLSIILDETQSFVAMKKGNAPLISFTVARTCCCSEQKIFARSDDCAALQKFLFVIWIIRIFTMKTEKFQLRGNNSMCAGAYQLLRVCAPAQLRGNTAERYTCSCALQEGKGVSRGIGAAF
jgi:hypothetical protein